MKTAAPLSMIPFREVRHDRPDDVLHYETIGVRGELQQWTIPAHRHHGLHQFQLLLRGSAEATLDGERHSLQAPAALMVVPGVVHGFVYAQDSVGHQVTLPSAPLRAILAQTPALLQRLAQTVLINACDMGAEVQECESLFARLATEFRATRLGRNEALHSHSVLLALWFVQCEAQSRAGLRNQALGDTLVQRYRMLIDLHFRAQRTVGYYAAELGVTADHLSRLCRAASGTGALELLHERVLLEARRLLAYTPSGIAAIAEDLGFEDPAYFSRFFAKMTRQPPSRYRLAIARGIGLLPDRPSAEAPQRQSTPARRAGKAPM